MRYLTVINGSQPILLLDLIGRGHIEIVALNKTAEEILGGLYKYMSDATNKEKFLQICKTHIKREGVAELLDWLEHSDFFEAPASTRFHGSYPGGLLEHSLNVYEELQRVLSAYPEIKAEEESIAIVALMHDLCKVNFYVAEKRNRKNDLGKWESYDAYTTKEKFCFGGHGSKSVFLVQNFMKLWPEEAVAINAHMGAFADEHVGSSYEQFPLAWALHVADEASTYIREKS